MRLLLPFLLLFALAGCGNTVSTLASSHVPSSHAGASAARAHFGGRLARIPLTEFVTAPIPARNLYQLTVQLKLRRPAGFKLSSRKIRHVLRTTSPNFSVGHQDAFDVLSEDTNHYFTMRATIEAETPHLYIYVENGMKLDHSALQASANTFENHIYPTDRARFGSEWRPGVDGDPHITLLLGDLKSAGAGGFYSAEDEYPRIVNPYSNQREMIYLNSVAAVPGDPSFDTIMAHEFQHMIHWHMHPHDNAWLNEGMSMLAEDINHYPPVDEPVAFLDLPDTQLNTWTLSGLRSAAHYGATYLFLAYLYDRFGSGLIREMLADSRYTDFALVNDALGKEGIRQTADGLFKEWVVANVLRNPSIDGGVYNYPQMQGKIAVKSISAPFTLSSQLHPYASKYLVLAPAAGKPLHLTFKALTSVPLVHLTQAGPFWWGNRGDMSATSLERSVDLSHVHHATLTFSTAYNIEKDYDYAYVEASTDGGITWATLRGSHTTTSNPNGASYGNAYTGVDRPGGGEVQEHIDLSRYGGRRILLRFQYVTDDEYTGEGIVLRNIAIPQIRWHDDFTGWQLHGFVPVFANTLPAQWHVQLIEYTTHRPRVAEMPLTGDQGTMTLDPGKMSLKKLVVAIYFTAPKTTVPSTYRVSVTTGIG